jgi:hypothetical protein
MKFTGTSTTPSFAVANATTAYSQQLRDSSANRSPFTNPCAASALAARFTAASNSAYVNRRSPDTTASLSG